MLPADEDHLKSLRTEEVFDTVLLANFQVKLSCFVFRRWLLLILEKCAQAFQAQMHLHDRYKVVNDRCTKFRKAGDLLKADNAKLVKERDEMERQKVVAEQELKAAEDRHQVELALIRDEVSQRDQVVADLKSRLLSIAAEAMCKARVELLKDYLSGAHSNWNLQELKDEVATFEELQGLDLEGSEEGVNDEVDAEGTQTLDKAAGAGENAAADVVDPAPTDAPTDAPTL